MPPKPNNATSRRSFLRYASLAAAGNAAGLRPFGMLNALASSGAAAAAAPASYKALVCVFLYGGNDGNNTIIPFDATGYGNYTKLRGPLALAQNSLLTLPGLPNFALHPNLPEIQALVNSGQAAIVANVGTLLQPTTRAQYLAGAVKPTNLFSHPDQQEEWQNVSASGSTSTGWAGRLADAMGSSHNGGASIPMVTSVAGDTLFCNGASTTPVAVSPGNTSGSTCSEGTECTARQTAAQSLLTFNSGLSLVTADDGITANSYRYAKTLADASASAAPLKTVFPANNGLAAQLKQIAQIIAIRSALGVDRQIFFCGIGNFDTHSTQLTTQATLLAGISAAIGAFYQSTQELGVADQVTTFTMSDFARTLQPNSNGGSDHGWGSHHFVVGGSVLGNKIYGTYPTLALGGPDDSGTNGRWIPSTASVQYASTLAQWFGVDQSAMAQVFPTLSGFKTTSLGFLG
ncbi:DUF1501 domain-containing protein [Terriglobus roseus]|uniref:Uncharacterized conserved protein, DUF1501 family n=1 Tax=Terriglobus roseus TaxID=392734 RepID=A0A1H4JRD9_9BACT|nr:DUF1501 domain-containing protein [Terriglobus roseus]SEB48505.1 Uncharacterized conserved protein, DUF1501 family [Terriglobus roseus]